MATALTFAKRPSAARMAAVLRPHWQHIKVQEGEEGFDVIFCCSTDPAFAATVAKAGVKCRHEEGIE